MCYLGHELKPERIRVTPADVSYDLLGMIMAGMPSTCFWSIARLMLGLGLALGVVTSIGDDRRNCWELPILALAINVLVALSSKSGLGGLGQSWTGYAVSIISHETMRDRDVMVT